MTDDPSRLQFIRTIGHDCDLDLSQNGVDGSFLNDETHYRFMDWQAAVEWATQRERERCAALCRKARDEQQLFIVVPIEVSARWEVAEECALLIEQEPKK